MRYALVGLLACAGLAHADLVCLPNLSPGAVVRGGAIETGLAVARPDTVQDTVQSLF